MPLLPHQARTKFVDGNPQLRQTHPTKDEQSAIKGLFAAGHSIQWLSEFYNLTTEQVWDIVDGVRAAKLREEKGLPAQTGNQRTLSQETKQSIYGLARDGVPWSEIAARLGISKSSVQKWLRRRRLEEAAE
jgi:hypothetical protein